MKAVLGYYRGRYNTGCFGEIESCKHIRTCSQSRECLIQMVTEEVPVSVLQARGYFHYLFRVESPSKIVREGRRFMNEVRRESWRVRRMKL
jgi:hypothetical protein